MVRPRKWRFLSPYIKDYLFKPSGVPLSILKIADLKGDEVEAMRLCDREELEQEDAGKKMGISRPTVQRLLYSGRKKVADALVCGKAIQITFPNYIRKRG
ncbi:MAG: DUF134 domain-containing protein [Candidatus Margulisiibacteriota bacterium]